MQSQEETRRYHARPRYDIFVHSHNAPNLQNSFQDYPNDVITKGERFLNFFNETD